jgi:hypothetical protein
MSGFSLVELTITAAIGMTLMIALSAAIVTQQRDQMAMKQNLEANELENDVRLFLSNPNNCLLSLGGNVPPPPDGTLLSQLVYPGSPTAVALSTGQNVSGAIIVTGMRVDRLMTPKDASGNPTLDGRWQLQLSISLKPVAGDQFLKDRTVEVYVTTDKTGVMTTCGAVLTPSTYVCETLKTIRVDRQQLLIVNLQKLHRQDFGS